MRRTHVGLIVILLTLPGCLTTLQAVGPDGPAVYGGARAYAHALRQKLSLRGRDREDEEERKASSAVGRALRGFAFSLKATILLGIDIPLTLTADTLLLPWSIPNELEHEGIEVRITPMRLVAG